MNIDLVMSFGYLMNYLGIRFFVIIVVFILFFYVQACEQVMEFIPAGVQMR